MAGSSKANQITLGVPSRQTFQIIRHCVVHCYKPFGNLVFSNFLPIRTKPCIRPSLSGFQYNICFFMTSSPRSATVELCRSNFVAFLPGSTTTICQYQDQTFEPRTGAVLQSAVKTTNTVRPNSCTARL